MLLVKLIFNTCFIFMFIKKPHLNLNLLTLCSMNKAFQKRCEYLLVMVFIHLPVTMRNPKLFFSHNLGHACKTTLSYI